MATITGVAKQVGSCHALRDLWHEICRVLAPPKRPLHAVVLDFANCSVETSIGVAIYLCNLGSPKTVGAIGLSCFWMGIVRSFMYGVPMYFIFILMLYRNGMKLSLLGAPGQHVLGVTSFGDPVDGLCDGMLLVSIGAGGPFKNTVLYVIQHSDAGSVALVLNNLMSQRMTTLSGNNRCGGPVQSQGMTFIHNIPDVPGAQRLLCNQPIFFSQRASLQSLQALAKRAFAEKDDRDAEIIAFRGISSWGSHQLEGEVRRGAWGWIKPEHVKPEDVFELRQEELSKLWERLINSPQLQIFHS